jgi:methylthioribose-1-phosphate isomerase
VSTTQTSVNNIQWRGSDFQGYLELLDQTLLPMQIVQTPCRDEQTVWEAIRQLRVRGAPAIGIAAAYGVVLGLASRFAAGESVDQETTKSICQYLASSRPTAVNLFWALDRMQRRSHELWSASSATESVLHELWLEALAIHDEDRAMCRAIGLHGATLLEGVTSALTHCNAGGLATGEYGTALSVFFTMQDQGRPISVFVDETRPLLQGARLTAWELTQRGIPATLICDSMAAHVMSQGRVQAVVAGADRIALNGDTANKIGTYGLAVLARYHNIPFYIAAPSSTFDLSIKSGIEIPIEERASTEITHGFGRQTAPDHVEVYNPAFDVTPGHLITAIITERGIISPVSARTITDGLGVV